MSVDLETQIREYAGRMADSQAPVTFDEVLNSIEHRDEMNPVTELRPKKRPAVLGRGAWPAVVGAAVVLVLFGFVAWVVRDTPTADDIPPPTQPEPGYYLPASIPEGFFLQDLDAPPFGRSQVVYLRETDGVWLPDDGGFAVIDPVGLASGLAEDPAGLLSELAEGSSGVSTVQIAGEPGVVLEASFDQAGIATNRVWVLASDGEGGLFELSSVGMTREEAIAAANQVERVDIEEFRSVGPDISWDIAVSAQHEDFAYEPPPVVGDVSDDVGMALGLSLLSPRLTYLERDDTTVVTTDDGSIVEPDEGSEEFLIGSLYLDVADNSIDDALQALTSELSFGDIQLSPEKARERNDAYVEMVSSGSVLSEDPYVIQAPAGPVPSFDTSTLGEELPLMAATTADVLPPSVTEPPFGFASWDNPAATEERPVVIVGTVQETGSDAEPVTVAVWWTESGAFCEGSGTGQGMGSACGDIPLARFGVTGGSTSEASMPDGTVVVTGEVSYTVPLETSVVQIVTPDSTYWQQPVAGYGLVPYGDTVERPTEIIAFDSAGNEIGRWEVTS